MKEISTIEMNDVSGAYVWDYTDAASFLGNVVSNTMELIGASTLGAAAGFAAGATIGGMHGGDGGGVLGFGAIGQLVGMIGGGIIGSVTVGVTGALTGWNETKVLSDNIYDSILTGNIA